MTNTETKDGSYEICKNGNVRKMTYDETHRNNDEIIERLEKISASMNMNDAGSVNVI